MQVGRRVDEPTFTYRSGTTIEITGIEQKAAWLERRVPPVEQVAPLVWSIPVDCTPYPVRYTFAYLLLNDRGDAIVVDPGLGTPLGIQQLADGLAAAGVDESAITGIVLTHFHPDHLGAASALADRTGVGVGMHGDDIDFFDRATDPGSMVDGWLDTLGLPEGRRGDLTDASMLAEITGLTVPGVRLTDGQLIDLPGRRIEVVWTPGHTAGHVCLVDYDSRLVLTGDHVLPRITPNVGVDPNQPERDAVADYSSSLVKIAAWDQFEAAPAHEYRFRGIAERAAELETHHRARTDEVRAVLAANPDATVWEIAQQLTWARGWDSLDGANLRAALAETLSHLIHARNTAA